MKMKSWLKKFLPFGLMIIVIYLVYSQINVIGSVITKVDVYKMATPYFGNKQYLNIKIPKNAKYHIANEVELRNSRLSFEEFALLDYIDHDQGVWWEMEGVPLSKNDLFVGKQIPYRMCVLLVANDGYTFADDVKIRINGRTSNVASFVDYGTELFVGSKDFYVDQTQVANSTVKNYIPNVDIQGLKIPKKGETPTYDFTLPKDAHYRLKVEAEFPNDYKMMSSNTIDGVCWMHVDKEEQEHTLTKTDRFEQKDRGYRVRFYLVANEGYAFADNVQVMIDGKMEYVERVGNNYNSIFFDSIIFPVDE